MPMPRYILTALLPLCFFTGAIMPGMVEAAVSQEMSTDIQDRESLLAEGDRTLLKFNLHWKQDCIGYLDGDRP